MKKGKMTTTTTMTKSVLVKLCCKQTVLKLVFLSPFPNLCIFLPEFHIAVVLLVIGQSGRVLLFFSKRNQFVLFIMYLLVLCILLLYHRPTLLLGGCTRDFVISDIKQI